MWLHVKIVQIAPFFFWKYGTDVVFIKKIHLDLRIHQKKKQSPGQKQIFSGYNPDEEG